MGVDSGLTDVKPHRLDAVIQGVRRMEPAPIQRAVAKAIGDDPCVRDAIRDALAELAERDPNIIGPAPAAVIRTAILYAIADDEPPRRAAGGHSAQRRAPK